MPLRCWLSISGGSPTGPLSRWAAPSLPAWSVKLSARKRSPSVPRQPNAASMPRLRLTALAPGGQRIEAIGQLQKGLHSSSRRRRSRHRPELPRPLPKLGNRERSDRAPTESTRRCQKDFPRLHDDGLSRAGITLSPRVARSKAADHNQAKRRVVRTRCFRHTAWVPATRRGRERKRTTSAPAAEGATDPRKRSGKRTAPGSGTSGKPTGVRARRTDGVRGAGLIPWGPESLRSRDRGGSSSPAFRRRWPWLWSDH